MTARIGSLFSGYGGLEMGISSVIDADTAWHVEFDQAPSRILAHHWPTVPNYGDITTVDWAAVEPVDILCGGFPCQDVSLAGLRRGLRPDTRSGLWSHFAQAIDALRPELVIVENVRGLLSAEAHSDLEPDAWDLGDRNVRPPLRALGAVLGDLADLGYDAEWHGVRAADAGAPHGRFRVFLAARPADTDGQRHGRREDPRMVGRLDRDHESEARQRERARGVTRDRSTPTASHPGSEVVGLRAGLRQGSQGRVGRGRPHHDRVPGDAPVWGIYEPAIRRWESTIGRLAPAPTEPGQTGAQRLSPRFVEFLMGLPAGHVTNPAIDLTRAEQLKALGNGVVPQQAALALTRLLDRQEAAA